MTVTLTGNDLTVRDVAQVARQHEAVALAPEAKARIDACRALLDDKVTKREIMYGVNTGIGEFSEVVLSPEQTERFQKYLIYSHAAGCGEPLPAEAVRAAILSRINVHCHGRSGLRRVVTETLVEMLNRGVTPVMCTRGSVGASGDLSPMAQMALVLMGEGEAFFKGERLPGKAAMERAGIPAVVYEARDGLAVINGSNVITGMGALQVFDADRLYRNAQIAAAMTMEALNINPLCLDERLHAGRGYPGAVACAANLRRLLEGSEILGRRKGKRVQDAYSLRSTPQVIGSALDAHNWSHEMLRIELNGVADNPLFFPETKDVVTGANFQGTPMAFGLELVSTAVTTVCVLSERRLNRLLNPALSAGLPAFLTEGAGMMSGLMLSQYTAGALICENRILCQPAAVGSIPAAADQEDFVSMGMTTALKGRRILDNAFSVVAIELMAAAQALDFLKPLKPAAATAAGYRAIRGTVAHLDEDRPLFDDINTLTEKVRDGAIVNAVEEAAGALAASPLPVGALR